MILINEGIGTFAPLQKWNFIEINLNAENMVPSKGYLKI